jgi:hypothetical protein
MREGATKREFEGFRVRESLFSNFHDQRERPMEASMEIVHKSVSKVPEGDRVALVLSKAEFGKVMIPLDLMGAEVIM